MIRSRPPALPLATLLALAALASCRDASLPTAAVSPGRPRLATAASACQVTNPDDGEPGSLRAAVQDPACAVVTFADAFSGGTVELMNGQLEVNRSLEIAGPTAGVTIRRRGETAHDRLLEVGAQGDVRLARLTLTGGVANPQSARAQSEGGAILNAGTLSLTDVTVARNRAFTDGGGILNRGRLILTRATVSSNTSTNSNGGGIYNEPGATAQLTNSTVSGNGAFGGGGGILNRGTLTLVHATVAANTAQFDGGGILGEAGTVILRNSLVSANSSQRRSDVSPDGGSIVALYTLIHTTLHGAGGTPVPVDAATGTLPVTLAQVGLGALGAHGGPTTTHPLLLTGSPALDAVPAGQCTEVTEDQRGVARPQMGACDLGAYELVPTSDATPPVITPTVTGTLGNGGWYTGNVTVAWTVSDDGSAITARTGCDPITITTDTPGLTLTCRATSVGGTSQQGVTVKRDATAPTLAPTVAPAVVLLNGTATAAAGAADATSGVTLAACDPAATTTVGARTVRCTATDAAGNTAAATAPYTVTYRFAGFEAPVANGGTLNLARAGLVIPLRWRLTDAAGAPVTTLTAAAVATAPILCPNGGGTNNIKTGASRPSAVRHLGDGVYQLDWQSPRDLANGCHTLRLDLGEGVARTALFRFSR